MQLFLSGAHFPDSGQIRLAIAILVVHGPFVQPIILNRKRETLKVFLWTQRTKMRKEILTIFLVLPCWHYWTSVSNLHLVEINRNASVKPMLNSVSAS